MQKIVIKVIICAALTLFSINSMAAIVVGNPNGTIELTEIYDYQCPHCRLLTESIDRLIVSHPELKVKLLPVAIMNKKSVMQAAYAVSRAYYHQDFEGTHNDFMNENFSSMETIHHYIETKNSSANVLKEMNSNKVKETILEGNQLMKTLNLYETPILIIQPLSHSQQPIMLVGEHSFEKLDGIISTYQRGEKNRGKKN